MAGPSQRIHPSKRHNNPMQYKNGKPRLRPLNLTQLQTLLDKTQRNRDKAKIRNEINRKQAILIK